MRVVYLLPIVGALIGGFEFLGTSMGAQSAPQQAAGAAMAVAWAVLPYVFARSWVELVERPTNVARPSAAPPPGAPSVDAAPDIEVAGQIRRRGWMAVAVVVLIAMLWIAIASRQ